MMGGALQSDSLIAEKRSNDNCKEIEKAIALTKCLKPHFTLY